MKELFMVRKYEKLIGKQIAKIRKDSGLSQAQLAEVIDVASETISRLERGVSIPSLKTLEEISHALNISLKDLLDFQYTPKATIAEREISKIVALLKTRKVEEIRLARTILKDIFKGLKSHR